jgi:protein-disulfide isomerase
MVKTPLRTAPRSLALALIAASSIGVAACRRPAGVPAEGGSAAPVKAVSGVGVVAEVNGAPIMASELEAKVAGKLTRLRQEEYDIRRQTLEELVAERLVAAEAAKRNLAPDELLRQEVDAKAEALPADQLDLIYEQNKERFAGQSREQALARIKEVLGGRAKAERRAAYHSELRSAARVAVRLEAPRVTVEIPAGAPTLGPANAPVTIVEFTDYQCPYCHRAQAVIDQVLSRYQGKVRFVHLDYPLDGHPGAVPAARAARCAGEQGKFWEYHRSVMTTPGAFDDADFKGRAARLQLNAPAFASCLSSERHDAAIQAGLAQGESLGVSGTPAYFVNGRMLSGARPLEAFTEIIDGEL